jgi:hypothetical protein
MNFFCRLFGHTWVHKSEMPKTSWNTDKSGLVLVAHPAGEPRFYEECARCKERRELPPIKIASKAS